MYHSYSQRCVKIEIEIEIGGDDYTTFQTFVTKIVILIVKGICRMSISSSLRWKF